MEDNDGIFLRIKSKYILSNIISFINKFLLYKLIAHSKSIQSKLNITLDNYKLLSFIKNSNFSLNKLFYSESEYNCDYNQTLNHSLERYNITKSLLEEYITLYYEEKKNEIKIGKNYEYYIFPDKIDINSPFFDFLITKEYFSEFFLIVINIDLLKKKDLKNKYISAINKLNGKNYSLFFTYETYEDLDYFKELQFNLKNIKKLKLEKNIDIIGKYDKKNSSKENYYDILFKELFTFNELFDNLLYLYINLKNYSHKITINSSFFKDFNNFKSLTELTLLYFSFDSKFVLDLANLKKLSLFNCYNITFSKDLCLNLKSLSVDNCEFADELFNMPNLEYYSRDKNLKSQNIIDLTKSKKLKVLYARICDFFEIVDAPLECLRFLSRYDTNNHSEIRIIRKILSIKTLKNIEIFLTDIKNEDILKIKDENASVTSLHVFSYINYDLNQTTHLLLEDLQNKFPNLKKFSLVYSSLFMGSFTLKIKENKDSKINEIVFKNDYNNNIIFHCGPFKDLISVKFSFKNELKNIKESFPVFSLNPKVNFESLRIFSFSYGYPIKISIINNIIGNLYKMPKLKNLSLEFTSSELKRKIYLKYIGKILSLNLVTIHFYAKLNDESYSFLEYYSINELKQFFPDIDYSKIQQINFRKINFN